MYKIIENLPDGIDENKLEEKFMIYIDDYSPSLRALRLIGPCENEIKENIKKNFSHTFNENDYNIDDTTLIFESNLNLPHYYYFFNPSKKYYIKYLYDEINKKYIKIKYNSI